MIPNRIIPLAKVLAEPLGSRLHTRFRSRGTQKGLWYEFASYSTALVRWSSYGSMR